MTVDQLKNAAASKGGVLHRFIIAPHSPREPAAGSHTGFLTHSGHRSCKSCVLNCEAQERAARLNAKQDFNIGWGQLRTCSRESRPQFTNVESNLKPPDRSTQKDLKWHVRVTGTSSFYEGCVTRGVKKNPLPSTVDLPTSNFEGRVASFHCRHPSGKTIGASSRSGWLFYCHSPTRPWRAWTIYQHCQTYGT